MAQKLDFNLLKSYYRRELSEFLQVLQHHLPAFNEDKPKGADTLRVLARQNDYLQQPDKKRI